VFEAQAKAKVVHRPSRADRSAQIDRFFGGYRDPYRALRHMETGMTMKTEETKTFFPWPNTLAGGWYRPGSAATDMMDAHAMRMQHFMQDVQKAYSEIYNRQMEAWNETGERISKSFQDLTRCQNPADTFQVEADLATAWLDGASQRAQNWFELGRKLQDSCASLARASFEDLRQQGEDLATEATEAVSQETSKAIKAVKSATKHAA
jgi:hypothetical protein